MNINEDVFPFNGLNNRLNITPQKVLENALSRLDILLPTPMKLILKEVSNVTKIPMTNIVIQALIFYLNNLDISETDLNLITVNRSKYLETIEKLKELESKIKEMSKSEEKYNKTIDEINELKRRLKEVEKKNKELERENKKLRKKVERCEKKDIILKLRNTLDESPESELLLSEAFTILNITHANDKSKFVNNHIKLNDELSIPQLRVYTFLDERLSNYIITTKNRVYDGKIIMKSKLKDIITEINEKIEKQKKLERLQKKMKEYKRPLEDELLKIKQKHPGLSEFVLEHVAKLNRTENPKQLMSVIKEIKEWLKKYSIQFDESIIPNELKEYCNTQNEYHSNHKSKKSKRNGLFKWFG